MSDSGSSSGGIGFFGVLFITFMVLKLTEVIDWSWWWVTSPLWIPVAIVLAVLAGAFALAFSTFVSGVFVAWLKK